MNESMNPAPEAKPDAKGNKKEEASLRRDIYDWVQCIVMAIIVCVLLFSFFVRLVDVVGISMNPTLEDGDKIIVSNLFYDPKPGDIIVFRKDEYREEPLVKRIIAVEGQTVDIDFDEPYIAELTTDPIDFTGEITVPEGCVFVMGDNRNHSTDSRYSVIGCVDERCIMGKVYFTIYPLKNFGSVYS